MQQNFDTTLGVYADANSAGQPVDFDGAFVSNLTITNNSGLSVQYSADSGLTWTGLSAGGSASPSVPDSTAFFIRKMASGGQPVPVRLTWRSRDSLDPSSVDIRGGVINGYPVSSFTPVLTYTWSALMALGAVANGTRAYVSDLGNAEFVYNSAAGVWTRNSALLMAAFAIPMVLPPSGTVGNNGALTLGGTGIISYAGTAGVATNCYMYFPANALYAGSPANFYFTQMTSATAGTVFANTYTAPRFGPPVIPTSPTPIVATGPGAFTADTSTRALFDITIPGKLLGPHGQIRCAFTVDTKNTAGVKTLGGTFGGAATFASAIASSQGYGFVTTTRNVNSRSKQVTLYSSYGDIGSAGQNTYTSSVDSSLDQDFTITGQLAVATDYIVLTGVTLEVICP